jgi:diguanylate cyclase (GGDEF)-like protein
MKILVADDDPVSRRVLQSLLAKWGYEVQLVDNGAAAWEQLKTPEAPRIALLDWMMPGLNGVDVCRALRRERSEPYTYILLLTANNAKENIVEGLESGADDYLTKPFNSQELKARIRVGSRFLELEDNLVEARESMRYKAMHDPLTSLWSRGAVLEILDREIIRSRRESLSLGVLIADLDHFKSVNDTYGHITGDDVLREVTRRMQGEVRPYDALGRYGGEEFLILLPGCSIAETAEKAEQLRQAVSLRTIQTQSGPLNVTISLGGTATKDWPGDSANQILQMADAALYHAKRAGRNCIKMASQSDHEQVQRPSSELSSQGPKNS